MGGEKRQVFTSFAPKCSLLGIFNRGTIHPCLLPPGLWSSDKQGDFLLEAAGFAAKALSRFSCCHAADDGSSLLMPERGWAITATPPALTATGDKQTQAGRCSRWLQCMGTPRDSLLHLPCSDLPAKGKIFISSTKLIEEELS